MSEFIWQVRVYYEDTDSGGVVYYANYLKFMERARTEWLRTLGVEQDQLIDKDDTIFAVRSAQVEFRRPARFNDLLNVVTSLSKSGGASLTFNHRLYKGNPADGAPLVEGSVKVASLSATTFKPKPIPEFILSELAREH